MWSKHPSNRSVKATQKHLNNSNRAVKSKLCGQGYPEKYPVVESNNLDDSGSKVTVERSDLDVGGSVLGLWYGW